MRKPILGAMIGVMSLGVIGGGVAFAKATRGGSGGRGGHSNHAGRGGPAHAARKVSHAQTGHYGRAARNGHAGNQPAYRGGNRGRAGGRQPAANGNRYGHGGGRPGHAGARQGNRGRPGNVAGRQGNRGRPGYAGGRNGNPGRQGYARGRNGNPGRHGYAGGRQGGPGRQGYAGARNGNPGRHGYAGRWHGYPGGYRHLGWYGYPGWYAYSGRDRYTGGGIQVVDDPDTIVVQPRVIRPAIEVSGSVGRVAAESVAEENAEVADEAFPERFLRVKNMTAEPMKVYVQFHTQVDEDKWMWVPAEPKESAKSVMLQVDAGAEAVLADNDGPIPANRVRIWAVGPSRRVIDYRNQDLWLVPEVNQAGEHVYRAPEIETFTYVLK
jgi:hypothetical protein